jgi:hypothetical protein
MEMFRSAVAIFNGVRDVPPAAVRITNHDPCMQILRLANRTMARCDECGLSLMTQSIDPRYDGVAVLGA